MIDVGLPFLKIDVIDFFPSIDVGFPLLIQFLGEGFLGQGKIINF